MLLPCMLLQQLLNLLRLLQLFRDPARAGRHSLWLHRTGRPGAQRHRLLLQLLLWGRRSRGRLLPLLSVLCLGLSRHQLRAQHPLRQRPAGRRAAAGPQERATSAADAVAHDAAAYVHH